MPNPVSQTTRPSDVVTSMAHARRLVREHWAELIRCSDMGAMADLDSAELVGVVWTDECARIANRLAPRRTG